MPVPHRQSPEELFYARAFALISIAVLALLLYRILAPLAVPIGWAAFLALLLRPLHRKLLPRLRGRANLSALLLTVGTALLLLGPVAALTTAFVAQLAQLLEVIGRAAGSGTWSAQDLAQAPVVGTLLAWLQDLLGVSPARLQGWLADVVEPALQQLASFGGRVFLGAVGQVVRFALAMFMLFFFIRDGGGMLEALRALIPMRSADKARLSQHLREVMNAVVYGTGLTALMQGALVGVGFLLVGLPSPAVFGALAAVLALIPLAGTPFVWVPAGIALAAQDRWLAALFLFGWGMVVATVDNFVRPLLVSGRANVGTLAVFIGVLGGIAAFGSLGVIAGPLILALAVALARFAQEKHYAVEE